jgi:hypothetical protein
MDSGSVDWPHKTETFKKWTDEEKDRVLEVFDVLPIELQMDTVKSIARAVKSKDHPNPATSAEGIIVLYDNVFDSNKNLARVLGHELAHQLYRDMPLEQKKDYGFAANWFPLDPEGRRYVSRKNGFVQDDGRESPEEDYANNIEYYLFEPKTLEKLTPQASRWIETVYRDKFKLRKGAVK